MPTPSAPPSQTPVTVSDVRIVRNHVSPAPVYYSNNVNVFVSQVEVRLTFMDTVPAPPGSDDKFMTGYEKVSVVMSPEFAIHLRNLLDRTLANYEANFGNLRELKSASASPSPSPEIPEDKRG